MPNILARIVDYGDILYDQTFNNSFDERLESIQCNAALTITCDIKDRLESLQQRR